MGSVFEGRFNTQVIYKGDVVEVRAWIELPAPADDAVLVHYQRKFYEGCNQADQREHLSLLSLARAIATYIGGATVEIMIPTRKLGAVYYPEWP